MTTLSKQFDDLLRAKIAELQAEYDECIARADEIKRKIEAAVILQEPSPELLAVLERQRQDESESQSSFVAQLKKAVVDFTGKGSRTFTPKAIAALLSAAGVRGEIGTRVSTEIHRLASSGKHGIRRIGHGKYELVKGEAAGAA